MSRFDTHGDPRLTRGMDPEFDVGQGQLPLVGAGEGAVRVQALEVELDRPLRKDLGATGGDELGDDRVETGADADPGCHYAASGEHRESANQVNVRKSNQVNFGASPGSFLEPAPRSSRTRPPDVVVGTDWTATRGIAGWRGRIRTFDLLIQSQTT